MFWKDTKEYNAYIGGNRLVFPYRCFVFSLTGWVNVTAKTVAWSRFGRSVRPATLELVLQGSFREECSIKFYAAIPKK
jgi:hypothetical protein